MRTSLPIFDLCDGSVGCGCPEKKAATPPHGDRTRYTNYGCQCLKCTEANTNYHRQWRERKNQEN